MAGWPEWGRSKEYWARARNERSWEHIASLIEWKLPQEMLPVHHRWRDRRHQYGRLWYVKDAIQPQSFVYTLSDRHTGIVFYVGCTDDPVRRLKQHMARFLDPRMTVVAVGGEVTEREWIEKYRAEGCALENAVAKPRKARAKSRRRRRVPKCKCGRAITVGAKYCEGCGEQVGP